MARQSAAAAGPRASAGAGACTSRPLQGAHANGSPREKIDTAKRLLEEAAQQLEAAGLSETIRRISRPAAEELLLHVETIRFALAAIDEGFRRARIDPYKRRGLEVPKGEDLADG